MKKALITGGSMGIGKATAEIFRQNGYEVTTPSLEELDLSNLELVQNYVDKHKNDGFEVLINNAGINEINMAEDISNDEITAMLRVNLEGPIYLLRGFIPAMKEKGYGRIVNIGSIWAVVSKPGRMLYSATKNAMHGVTNTLALELAPNNILVNTICPGFTLTDLTRKNNTDAEIAKIAQDIPLKRLATPEEMAKAIYYFASEENTYLTGQKICVDGGFTVQ